MKWPLSKLYEERRSGGYTSPPPSAEPLLKEKPFGGRISYIYKKVRSPSSASLCSEPSPFRGKAFIVLHFHHAWPVYLTIAEGYEQQMHPTPPPWHADVIGAGWRSQTIGEIFKGTDGACADPGTRIFPATGGGSAAFQFNSIDFHVTHRFFVSFLTQERNVPFRPPSIPHPPKRA